MSPTKSLFLITLMVLVLLAALPAKANPDRFLEGVALELQDADQFISHWKAAAVWLLIMNICIGLGGAVSAWPIKNAWPKAVAGSLIIALTAAINWGFDGDAKTYRALVRDASDLKWEIRRDTIAWLGDKSPADSIMLRNRISASLRELRALQNRLTAGWKAGISESLYASAGFGTPPGERQAAVITPLYTAATTAGDPSPPAWTRQVPKGPPGISYFVGMCFADELAKARTGAIADAQADILASLLRWVHARGTIDQDVLRDLRRTVQGADPGRSSAYMYQQNLPNVRHPSPGGSESFDIESEWYVYDRRTRTYQFYLLVSVDQQLLSLDFRSSAVDNLYRTANAMRNEARSSVLTPSDYPGQRSQIMARTPDLLADSLTPKQYLLYLRLRGLRLLGRPADAHAGLADLTKKRGTLQPLWYERALAEAGLGRSGGADSSFAAAARTGSGGTPENPFLQRDYGIQLISGGKTTAGIERINRAFGYSGK